MSEVSNESEGSASAELVEVHRVPASIGGGSAGDDVSMLELAGVLLRHRWVIAGASAAAGFVLVLHGLFFVDRTWTTTVAFTPQIGQMSQGRLSGLASQFGVSIPSGEPVQSPDFYADLLQSRQLLSQVVESRYGLEESAPSGPAGWYGPGNQVEERRGSESPGTNALPVADDTSSPHGRSLVEVYGIEAENRSLARAVAIDRLKSDLAVATDLQSGVVRASVSMPTASLAASVSGRLLELITQFNIEARQSQASAEREFLEGRLQNARADLRAAEDSLRRFLERNRRYENSPELVFEQQRLRRRVDAQQQIYTSLSQSLEQAKVEEVRNTPVVTVVQGPEPPARPDGRGLFFRGALGLLVGGMFGVLWAFGSEFLSRAREQESDEYSEVTALARQAVRDVTGALRWLRGRLGRSGERT